MPDHTPENPSPQEFEARVLSAWPAQLWKDVTILIAVSGGADSVAMLRALDNLKRSAGGTGSLHVAHLNHQLREEASERDAQYVRQLAEQHNLPCKIGRRDIATLAAASSDGLEAVARQARYAFLRATAEQVGARYVAVAHTLDDQVETILHRIVRGTGIAGLAGIRTTRRLSPATTLVRPLLSLHRAEIEGYLKALEQDYCVDESNRDLQITRNRIRADLLPQLRDQYNPQVDKALLRLGSLAAEAQSIVDSLVAELEQQAVSYPNKQRAVVDCELLRSTSRYLIRELMIRLWQDRNWPRQNMGHDQWDSLADVLIESQDTKQIFPGMVVVERIGTKCTFER